MHFRCLAAVLLIAVSGCATHKTVDRSVAMRMILPASAARQEVRRDEVFLMPARVSSPMPEFPEPVGSLHPSAGSVRTICVALVVDEQGDVSTVDSLPHSDGCDPLNDPIAASMLAATLKAVGQWTFTAAAICRFSDPGLVNDDCSGDDVDVRVIPVKLAYAFEFLLVDGQPAVRMRQ